MVAFRASSLLAPHYARNLGKPAPEWRSFSPPVAGFPGMRNVSALLSSPLRQLSAPKGRLGPGGRLRTGSLALLTRTGADWDAHRTARTQGHGWSL
jgi:hypothetical protein